MGVAYVTTREDGQKVGGRGGDTYIDSSQGIITAYSYFIVSIVILCLSVEPGMLIYSGGEVDREAGTAFLYRTIEELKTVSKPVGRGLSTTTTKVVTDQKYWLAKAEPLDDDTRQLPEAWGVMDEDDEFTAEFTNPLFTEMNDSMAYAVQPPSPSVNGSSGRPGSSLSMDASSSAAYQQRMKDVRFRRRARQPRGTSSVDEKSFLKEYNDYLMET